MRKNSTLVILAAGVAGFLLAAGIANSAPIQTLAKLVSAQQSSGRHGDDASGARTSPEPSESPEASPRPEPSEKPEPSPTTEPNDGDDQDETNDAQGDNNDDQGANPSPSPTTEHDDGGGDN